jgi:methylated-DNA-[protein]-cysteine S-methyltransferase
MAMSDDPDEALARGLRALAASPPGGGLAARLVSRWTVVEGPVGPLYVAFSAAGISFTRIPQAVDGDEGFCEAFRHRFRGPVLPASAPPPGLAAALRTGSTRHLSYDLRQLTGFERDVLAATAGIPRGETRSYGWVAREIGRPAAVRAVGSALGRNPVPLLIPCHRVTRSNGDIGEYVFGSLIKGRLLAAERGEAAP